MLPNHLRSLAYLNITLINSNLKYCSVNPSSQLFLTSIRNNATNYRHFCDDHFQSCHDLQVW